MYGPERPIISSRNPDHRSGTIKKAVPINIGGYPDNHRGSYVKARSLSSDYRDITLVERSPAQLLRLSKRPPT